METLSEFTAYIAYLPLVISFFALFYCWKDIGARWLLTLLITIGCFDSYSLQYTIHWTTHYYGWVILLNLLFIAPIIFRNAIALRIYKATQSTFFLEASKLKFSQQEAAIMFLCLISIAGHAISYVEVFLYKNFVIDILYFKNFVLAKLQIILSVLSTLAILSFAFKTKGLNYAQTKTV